MRIDYWARLSWWQRSRLAMACAGGAAAILAVFVAIFISALDGSRLLPSLSWLSFTAFPLIIVVAIASFARLQQRINVRSPQSREEHNLSNRSAPQ